MNTSVKVSKSNSLKSNKQYSIEKASFVDLEVEEEVETNSNASSVDDELAEAERILQKATEVAIHLRMKKQLLQRSGEFLEKLKISKNEELKRIEKQIEDLEKKKETIEDEIETLDGIDEDEDDVMEFLTENYAEFVNEIAFSKKEATKASSLKKEKPKTEGKEKGKRTQIDRGVYPDLLLDRMRFRASGYHKVHKEQGKIVLDIIFNGDTKKFYNIETKKEYAKLQDANRDWCHMRGHTKLGNAWEDFKALNINNNKTRSIDELHNDNWLEVEDMEHYIDIEFMF